MSPQRKDDDRPDPFAPSVIAEGDDAEDPRTYTHDDAEAVRNGELSAAQLPGGGGNVDPNNPDAQYPPGRVETTAGVVEPTDLRSFVPERPRRSAGLVQTDANPDYRTNGE